VTELPLVESPLVTALWNLITWQRLRNLSHIRVSLIYGVERCTQARATSTVCCSVLQCVAVWCSVVQCGAVWCRVLQCVAVRCSVLQCVAWRCSALQCVAVRCMALQCVAWRCSALQCVAGRCSVLQYTSRVMHASTSKAEWALQKRLPFCSYSTEAADH